MGGVDVHPSRDVKESGVIVYLVSGFNDVNTVVNIPPVTANVSGQVIYLVSGHNEVIVTIPPVTTNISGQPVRISGETVYLVSGNNAVQMSGQVVQVSGQTVIGKISGETVSIAGGINVSGSPVRISGEAVRISGETVSIAGGINVSGSPVRISGEAVRISGEAVRTSGETAIISGQPVIAAISGQAVLISGQTVVASVTTNISGQTVYLVSGQNRVQNSGQTVYPVSGKAYVFAFDPSGQTWNDLYVQASGGHKLSVDATVNATAQVSGQVVYLRSGQNDVQISGQAVSVSGNVVLIGYDAAVDDWTEIYVNASGGHRLQVTVSGDSVSTVSGKGYIFAFDPSGNTWNELYVHQSGGHKLSVDATVNATAQVSGQVVYLRSGQNDVQISGQAVRIADATSTTLADVSTLDADDIPAATNKALNTMAGLFGYDKLSDNYVRLRSTASGQGISGIPYRLVVALSGDPVSISGQPVSISGQTVVASVTTNISGQTVYLVSGQNPVQVSGQAVRTSGDTAIISGQPIRVSGEAVRAYAFDQSGNTWVEFITNTSGGKRVQVIISGDTVNIGNTPIAVTTSISGNVVRVSGETISVSGVVSTSVSGNMVSVSGQPVSVSGNIVATSGQAAIISGQPIGVSGQVSYLVSGQNPVQLYGFIESSGQWTQIRVTQSGQGISGIPSKLVVTFSGDSVIGSVSGNMVSVSGQAIAVSGQAVLISGQTVVASVTTNISGQTVYLASGNNDTQVSGQAIRIGGDNTSAIADINDPDSDNRGTASDSLNAIAFVHGYNRTGQTWTRVDTTASGSPLSGALYRLAVALSGDPVTVSGNSVVTASGSIVAVAGQVTTAETGMNQDTGADSVGTSRVGWPNVSRNYGYSPNSDSWKRIYSTISGGAISGAMNKLVVAVSGDPVTISGNVVTVSGNTVVPRAGTTVRSRDVLPLSNASGGTILASGDVVTVTLRNVEVSGNPFYVGGVSGESPYSGHGFFLQGGDGITLNVSNFNQIAVFNGTATSGKLLSYLGMQY